MLYHSLSAGVDDNRSWIVDSTEGSLSTEISDILDSTCFLRTF